MTGVSAAHWLVDTSSGSSPAGKGGWFKVKYWPKIFVLNGTESEETREMGFTATLKNGEDAPG